jgi:alcohol dehydrogenase class IV
LISNLQLPRTLFGVGALSMLGRELALLGVARPLLVTDAGVIRAGLTERLESALAHLGAIPTLSDVTENPIFADADRGALLYARMECDGVIALGGGSVIDAAKYVALLAANGGTVARYAGRPNAPHGRCAPLAVLPTTAGTGSEASPDAGIHPDATTPSTGMSSPAIIPHLAILDPQLTATLPAKLTAATGIDAISHCIEGYFSCATSPFTDILALDGIARGAGAIRRATECGDDLEARAEMLTAAYCGGAAIGMGLGPAHAIAISCGDQGFNHGILSGIGLVCSVDRVALHAPERAAAVARALGIAPDRSIGDAIAALMRALDLPATLEELGYLPGDLIALGARAHSSPFNLSARVHPSAEDYVEMLRRSCGAGGR